MIDTYYQSMYRELLAGSSPIRFMFFEPQDRTGWGNRLRGLTLAILMAVATRRILVIKDFVLEEHFAAPEGCQWRYHYWKKALAKSPTDCHVMDLHLQPSNWNQSEWESYRTLSMEDLFPARTLILRESIGFFDQLIANPHYQKVWAACGLPTETKVGWLGMVTEAFLNRPRPRLRRLYRAFVRRWAGSSQPNVLIQFRTFYDIGAPNAALLEDFVKEVQRMLPTLAVPQPHIYVATDSEAATRFIGEGLSQAATVSLSKTKVVHTGALHNGWELLAEKVLNRITGREHHFLDFWFWLPEYFRPRPHTAVLAEWMFFGTCEVAISTFTSFSVYAMARTGNRAKLYFFDTERRVVTPLAEEKYYF